jgi:hypothetical protein
MYENKPVKANLNGEPTYEAMGGGKNGLGWWQGEEAWNQLMHGGTMGVVYGAATLWQWKVTADETGWNEWTDAPMSWREALDLEGSHYIGYVSRAFEDYDFTDMEKRWDLAGNNRPLLAVDGRFYVSYLEKGGQISIRDVPEGLPFRWFDPATGEFTEGGITLTEGTFISPGRQPWVLIIGERTALP